MNIRYIGSGRARVIPLPGGRELLANKGRSVAVPDDVGAALLRQARCWAAAPDPKTDEELRGMSRADLNAFAASAGVADAEKMSNKDDVIAAIRALEPPPEDPDASGADQGDEQKEGE
jgi:hypothetical protein